VTSGPDDPASDAADEEELALGRTWVPARVSASARSFAASPVVRTVGVLGAVAALVVGVQALRPQPLDGHPHIAVDAASAGSGSVSPFDEVAALASRPLVDRIRQVSAPSACTPVAPGHAPERSVRGVLRQLLDGVQVVDSARTLDQFVGLCAIEVRATAPGRVVLTVLIAAPAPRVPRSSIDALEVGIETHDDVTTEYAQQVWHTGWSVLVGASGPVSAVLPRTRDLTVAAQSPALLW
jgi:hypothetical protein